MPSIQESAHKALTQAQIQASTPVQSAAAVKPPATDASSAPPAPNKAAFDRVLKRQPAQTNLFDPALFEASLNKTSAAQLQQQASGIPRPTQLLDSRSQLTGKEGFAAMKDQELVLTLMRGQSDSGKSRYTGVLRNAEQIAASGILQDIQLLDARGITPPASEFDRSPADDAVLVMRDFGKMSPHQIEAMKEQAYRHPEIASDLEGAIEKNHYGSERHKAFGALVEKLSGGILSAEEAMSMCPCGGIPGDGPKEIPLISTLDPIARHAMRHDATGFLLTRFGVGPGYGSKTTIFGREKNDPLAGQILGVAREILNASELPNGVEVATPGRFNETRNA